MKIKTYITLFLVLLTFSAHAQRKSGYVSITTPKENLSKLFADKLREHNIEFYSYVENNQKYYAYPAKEQDKVSKINEEIFGTFTTSKNMKSLCSKNKSDYSSLIKVLSENNLSYTTLPGYDSNKFCVYWPKEIDKKVETASPLYRSLKPYLN